MARFFNTAGPCRSEIHYTLSSRDRLPNIQKLIQQQSYFVLHAPRQTGKSTAMLELATELTDAGQFTAILLSAEVGAAFPSDPGAAELAMLGSWQRVARQRLPESLQPPTWAAASPGQRIQAALQSWSERSPRPLVIFIDEIDAIQDETLVSMLRQLRDGFPDRPTGFPLSVGLIGLRDVRDYKVTSAGNGTLNQRLNTASPFNIKVASLILRDFNREEVASLYQQHRDETGQFFTEAAIDRVFELTQGQPWLVNAIAKEITEELVPDVAVAIEVSHVNIAKEILIQRRDTHIDSLAERLGETRVRAIVEPMLAGQELGIIPSDDIQFVIDLGLVRRHPQGGLEIANPIYNEVLPRVLAGNTQDSLPRLQPTWLTAAGELNEGALLDAFLGFWKQHGQPLLRGVAYHEIAPHIVLMAFLHRVVNGGGSIEREYAIGSDRLDLCLRYRSTVLAMELKVWRDGNTDPIGAGLEQLDRYLAGLELESGWLVIFDQRSGLGRIADRTTIETVASAQGKQITVIRG
jgi:hypothetical protein